MFKQLLGDPNARKLKRFFPIVTDINILEESKGFYSKAQELLENENSSIEQINELFSNKVAERFHGEIIERKLLFAAKLLETQKYERARILYQNIGVEEIKNRDSYHLINCGKSLGMLGQSDEEILLYENAIARLIMWG